MQPRAERICLQEWCTGAFSLFPPAHSFLLLIFILLGIGLMMVLSASAPSALTYNGDSYYFFKSQAKNALLGIAIMLVLSLVDYRIYKGRIADLMMIRSLGTIGFDFCSRIWCDEK